ncbi:MAG: extracellular solute-binding protein [Lachnospiraceae bacterium]|nr:extracellular solute-binding protein [Lachnospiraceae bacterium]
MRLKILGLLLLVNMLLNSSCKMDNGNTVDVVQNKTTIEVVTSFFNGYVFRNAYLEWEEMTGNVVIDNSTMYDEASKGKVLRDFETSSEPDVLYFFNGADANPFIKAGKVISIAEIREYYPEYAMNMDDERIPAATDGVQYAVPVIGFWEALYINTEILAAAGVRRPGEDYTWEQFLLDCEAIKSAGFIPIAAALGHVPHYWWENTVFNHTTPETHLKIPEDFSDEQGQAWYRGMMDIQSLYDDGYFPANTLTITDDESFNLFVNGQAAFLLDGSWKLLEIVNTFNEDEDALDKFDITFVPTRGGRRATDLIGGLSMGYYITKKAWDDPEKREAAVSFVKYMTSTEVVYRFAQHTATALIDELDMSERPEFSNLQAKAIKMVSQTTSYTRAVQDEFQGKCREPIFDGLADILAGDTDLESAIRASLLIYEESGTGSRQ